MTRLAAHQVPASRLREVLRGGGLDELPDAELLQRFARYGEHPAFDVLLRRHGPMVLGVCRRVLINSADVDDAFQATFLIFVRKARTLRHGERVGPWLYGVAVRVSLKARVRRARLAARRIEATDMIPDSSSPPDLPDWLPVLDLELQALPAKYREPLVLCELDGASRAEAARALGIPEGTLSSRLARGRELLRRRLLKHGTLLPAGGLVALFTTNGIARAAIPSALLAKTSEVAADIATGQALAGTVPAGAAQLTDEVLKGMMLTKLRAVCGAVLTLGLVSTGVLAAWPTGAPAQAVKVGNAKGTPPKSGAAPDSPDRRFRGNGQELRVEFADKGTVQQDHDAFQGLWVLDKLDVFKNAPPEQALAVQQIVGKMQFLVAGDVWWSIMNGTGEAAGPLLAKMDSSKNPKWLDLTDFTRSRDETRCIYELSGDRLRICMGGGTHDPRPAEFGAEDDSRYLVYEFRREKLPPAAGDKALVGSWQSDALDGVGNGQKIHVPPRRVEILDGYLFATISHGDERKWVGGRYTVDETKNPKWIDVDVGGPLGEVKASKLYGSYEVVEGKMKLALGTTGKRLMRPLELNDGSDVLYYDVKAIKDPIPRIERIIHEPPAIKSKVEPLPGTPATATTPKAPPPVGPMQTAGAPQSKPKSLPEGPASKPAPAASPTKQQLPDPVPPRPRPEPVTPPKLP